MTILNSNIYFADANLFDVFKVEILRGDPARALAEPHWVMPVKNLSIDNYTKEI
jgi:hypothetical protein